MRVILYSVSSFVLVYIKRTDVFFFLHFFLRRNWIYNLRVICVYFKCEYMEKENIKLIDCYPISKRQLLVVLIRSFVCACVCVSMCVFILVGFVLFFFLLFNNFFVLNFVQYQNFVGGKQYDNVTLSKFALAKYLWK